MELKKRYLAPRLSVIGTPVLPRTDSGKTHASVSSGSRSAEFILDRVDEALLTELPAFERHEESTAIELFYDLFFIANLTTFSNIHEINDTETLTSYIGFFCILWFTWCVTSLYDVRFVTDSVLARMAKGVHLGVMVGLAVSGPKFNTDDTTPQLKVIALILTVSRLVLALQYLLIMYHVRQYKNSKLPLALMGVTNVIGGILYFGISFAFKSSAHAYRAFYVIAGFEMVVNIGISWQWKVLTFKGTHLIERMTLLTLYILGEGVIDVLKSVATISKAQDTWTSANIVTLFGAITTIYLIYMLYFDTLNRHDFGSFRQQLWSFLHFPLHVALILCLSGMGQFVIWQKIMEGYKDFVTHLESQLKSMVAGLPVVASSSSSAVDEYIDQLKGVVSDTFKVFKPVDLDTVNDELDKAYESIKDAAEKYISSPSNDKLSNMSDGLTTVMSLVWKSIMATYGFEVPETGPEDDSPTHPINAATTSAELIFDYFYIATGFTLMIIGVLSIVNTRSYTRWFWFRFMVLIMFGVGTCLLSLLTTGDSKGAFYLTTTPWPLPMIAIIVVTVLAVHHISWEDKEAEESTGEKHYHFLPRWRPNRHSTI